MGLRERQRVLVAMPRHNDDKQMSILLQLMIDAMCYTDGRMSELVSYPSWPGSTRPSIAARWPTMTWLGQRRAVGNCLPVALASDANRITKARAPVALRPAHKRVK